MNPNDEKLNQILDSVQVKAASADLADRIIAASQGRVSVEKTEESIFTLIANSLLVFKPAPMMAGFLIVGMLSGWYIGQEPASASLAVEDELMEFIDYELSML